MSDDTRQLHPAHGGFRRRLWEFPCHAHCPVIGVCLPLRVLRRACLQRALSALAEPVPAAPVIPLVLPA